MLDGDQIREKEKEHADKGINVGDMSDRGTAK